MVRVNESKWVPRKNWEKYVYSTLQPSIRFERDQCIDLPPLITEAREADMSAEQRRMYEAFRKQFLAETASGTVITAFNEGVKRTKLLQVACGAIYDGDRLTHLIDCKPKLRALEETLLAASGPVLIYTPYRPTVPMLKEFIERRFGHRVATIQTDSGTGNISLKKRTELFRQFQAGEIDEIVTGLELAERSLRRSTKV